MSIRITLGKGRVPVKIWTQDVEPEAIQQLVNVSQLPIVHGHIAAMPDVHAGIGATVGSVIPTRSAIIPAAVGVDIGCGMNAVRLSIKAAELPDNLYSVRSAIEAAVPVGFSQHQASKVRGSRHARAARVLDQRLDAIIKKHPALMKMQQRFSETWICQLATPLLLFSTARRRSCNMRAMPFCRSSRPMSPARAAARPRSTSSISPRE